MTIRPLGGVRGICSRLFHPWLARCLIRCLARSIVLLYSYSRRHMVWRNGLLYFSICAVDTSEAKRWRKPTFRALPAQALVVHHVLGPLDVVAGGADVGAAQVQNGGRLRLRPGLRRLQDLRLGLGLRLRALLLLLLRLL